MNLLQLRQELSDMCQKANGAKPWAKMKGISHSHVSAVIRGDRKPGIVILNAMGKRRILNDRNPAIMKFEDITN